MPSWLVLLLLWQNAAAAASFWCHPGHHCAETCSDHPASGWIRRCGFRWVCCPIKKHAPKMREKGCGMAFRKGLEGLVIGGRDAEPGKWPWMVSILCKERKGGKHIPKCTGFLIDQRHVLTAAHCFTHRKPHKYLVRLIDPKRNDSRVVKVSRLLLHPHYSRRGYHDDVALLTLSEDQRDITPVCLPPAAASTHATLLGWGTTRPSGGPMSKHLQELSGLPLVSAGECKRALRDRLPMVFEHLSRGLDDSLICAGGVPGKDSCRGDSGGPLLVQEKGRWVAVGVVAFGSKICGDGVPGVYSSVAFYLPWIERNKCHKQHVNKCKGVNPY